MKNPFVILFSLLSFTCAAAPISPEEALERFMHDNKASNQKAIRANSDYHLVKTVETSLHQPALYAFSNDKGFILLAADDCIVPMLGYSEDTEFSVECPSFEWWLQEYTRQIEYLRDKENIIDVRLKGDAYESFEEIKPLMTTAWNQSSPYNRRCPEINGRRCATGCVATAMAQVMNYWKYPERGTGSIRYTVSDIGLLELDFSEQPFEWADMLDSYHYGQLDAESVAYLMKACGYSVNMKYGIGESGALIARIGPALINYFGYDRGIAQRDRDGYSDEQWVSLVYNELKNVGPLIYSGSSFTGAHCFVCDGYRSDGYFHINWGWGGMSDGYFLLSALNPASQGIGGSEGGYNYNQTVTAGVTPPLGRLSLLDASISNAAGDSGNVSGKGFIYRINDFRNILLNLKVRVTGGVMKSPIFVSIYETDPETMKNIAMVYESSEEGVISLGDNEVGDFVVPIDFSSFDPSKLYTLTIAYELKNEKTFLSSMRLAASSGVDEISDCSNGLYLEGNRLRSYLSGSVISLKIYTVAGEIVMNESGRYLDEVDISRLPKGIYIAEATDINGRIYILKIFRS